MINYSFQINRNFEAIKLLFVQEKKKDKNDALSHLSLDESMCPSVFVSASQGNTENFRHLTDSFTAQKKKKKEKNMSSRVEKHHLQLK